MRKFKLLLASAAMLLACALGYAQNISVKGTVTDVNGEPVPAAGVIVSGTSNGVVTDGAGQYSINVPADGALSFSALGFVGQTIPVQGRNLINVVLMEDTELIQETIVVAYGTASKRTFTGSAAVVDDTQIEKKIITNVTSALAGTTAGVQMITSSGDPTSNNNSIRIRGFGSMSAGNAPLIVVDGVPYDGAMNDINPQDVESMTVLKDAAASAIYGHRGANGVIVITTKKGEPGEARIKFDARYGVNSRLIPQYDVIDDPAQYYETWYKKLYNNYYYSNNYSVEQCFAHADAAILDETNGGLGYQVYTVPDGELFIGRNFKLNPNAKLGYSDGTYYYIPDNWFDEAYNNGTRQEYNVSASGATSRFNYYASAGYLNDQGMIANSGLQRYTTRINAEYQAKDWLKFTTNTTFTHSESQLAPSSTGSWGSSGNPFYITNMIAPIYPLYVRKLDDAGNPYIYKEDGRVIYDAANNTGFTRPSLLGNAVRDAVLNNRKTFSDALVGQWGVVATPLKGLRLSANVSVVDRNSRTSSLSSPFGSATSTDGAVTVSHSRFMSVNNQYLAEYDFKLAEDHHFDILAGYEKYSYLSQSLSGSNDYLFDPYIGELNNADGKTDMSTSSSTSGYMTEGFLGHFQYDYKGKYILGASFRRDASSNFAPEARWGNFGSVSAAWVASEEAFLKDVDAIDMLKVRVDYGVQGNDDIGQYYYTNWYTHSYNEATKVYSIAVSYKGNPDLTWETNKSLSGGVDFELLNGYLNGSLDIYSRTTEDLLYRKDVPLSSGNPVGWMYTNVGSIRNTGFEASLNGTIIRTKKVIWNWNANASHYKNVIIDLDESVKGEGIKGGNAIYKIGGSLYEAYMRKYAGVNPKTGEALYYKKVKDANGEWTGESVTTSVFSDADQYEVGSILPKLYGGFGTSLNAYGFDFSAQFSYQLGGRYYDGTYQSFMQTQDNPGGNIHKDILLAWTEDNPNTDVPRWDGDTQVGQTAVDRFLVSSNYLSINNVTLGYTLPTKLVQKIKLGSVRFYVAGENLYVFSARKGVDPRFSVGLGSYTSGSGISNSAYSALRNITGGVTVTF